MPLSRILRLKDLKVVGDLGCTWSKPDLAIVLLLSCYQSALDLPVCVWSTTISLI